MKSRGFTLIELLIVIAIILILIAIALPNFLEAQVRAKVTKCMAEERTLETAMEEYFQDFKMYPTDHDNDELTNFETGMFQLTSPIKYMSTLPYDPFNQGGGGLEGSEPGWYEMASCSPKPREFHSGVGLWRGALGIRNQIHAYIILGAGPDGGEGYHGNDDWPWSRRSDVVCVKGGGGMGGMNYAPTNGTKSRGDIMKYGGSWKSGHHCIDEWWEILGQGAG